MRKHFACAIALTAIFVWGSATFAGDFHSGASLVCSDCHVMHFSQSHGYNPDGTGNFTSLGATPHEGLLRNEINDLCLSCHDGQSFAPDVFEAHGNGYVRQAGALNEVGGNGLYPPPTGHTLGSTDTPPGYTGTWTETLNCVNCHAAHGGGLAGNSYRNLGGFGTVPGPFVGISYSAGPNPNDLNTWVYEDASGGTNAAHYGFGSITFNEPMDTGSAYADFCQACHTNFHGDVGGPEIGGSGAPPQHFIRHPNLDVQIGAVGGGHSSIGVFGALVNQVQVMSPDGVRAGSYTTEANLTPSCMSCHKAHGNQNAFGLIYMAGAGTIDEQGDDGTGARDTCKQCHVQGG